MKYWLNGIPYVVSDSDTSSGGMKYWLNGVVTVVNGSPGIGSILKVSSVEWFNINKVGGTTRSSILKVAGVTA